MDHSTLKIAYDNDSGSISEDFLIPCLKSCSYYRRTTYSFSSGVFKAWAGTFSRLVAQNIKIEILCDMTQICMSDEQLINALQNTISQEQRLSIISKMQDTILLDALTFDFDSDNLKIRANILEWMLATERFKLKFAWPKNIVTEHYSVQPLYHKKMGYFGFEDGSIIGFSGSWNETIRGSQSNLEDCSVFSSKVLGDENRLNHIVDKVDRDWFGNNSKFDVLDISNHSLEIIKNRASQFDPSQSSRNKKNANKETFFNSEECLRPYQIAVLDSWENNGRKGIVKHATGSGKTFTALFAMRRHLSKGGVCLVIVPSRLLLQQWNIEIVKVIPNAQNTILNVGTGYSAWKKNLRSYSRSSSSKSPRIIVAITNSARSENFLKNLYDGQHLMLISDEVHCLGSSDNRRILDTVKAGAKLGLSATPERFMDPTGTARIFEYFGNPLEPIYKLKDAIGKALVPYEYFPVQCHLTDDELVEWIDISSEINRLLASCKTTADGELIPSEFLKLRLIARARIAKQAENKILVARKIITDNFFSRQKWLIYCDSERQMQELSASLDVINIPSSYYYSAMSDAEKEMALKNFKVNGGILLSIKCLDEGIDIPSITHALIVASDQNPRQFIQRRGRVLRRDPLNKNKDKAYIWDIVLTVADNSEDSKTLKGLCVAELKRSLEFSLHSYNCEISSKKLRDIARNGNITNEDLELSNEDFEEFDLEEA